MESACPITGAIFAVVKADRAEPTIHGRMRNLTRAEETGAVKTRIAISTNAGQPQGDQLAFVIR